MYYISCFKKVTVFTLSSRQYFISLFPFIANLSDRNLKNRILVSICPGSQGWQDRVNVRVICRKAGIWKGLKEGMYSSPRLASAVAAQ
jgi:hypothetical protein